MYGYVWLLCFKLPSSCKNVKNDIVYFCNMSVTYLSNEKKPDYSLCVRVSVSNPCGKSVTMFFFKCYSFSNIVLRSAEQPCAWTQTKGHEVPNYSNHSKLCPQWLSWTKLRGGANLKSRTNVVCKP